ncbi:sensor histidine kinase [Planosporangium mesophilum]|uniref:histidine kinase n=1 Tax=Planosporangium mesophilum TaxID=689768 RepID=A0A8J3TGA9_9ACTN|nr:ATP-binding protein [Planosporangium mesophilum]NJC85981.1 hypothetical protein [Planosporangium mesophilum]GII25918.1 histidine kinase [Planosporangium mesophilum]
MSRRLTWRQRMARRLDPTLEPMPSPRVIDAPPPRPHDDRAQNLWPAICEQFALRVLATAYQMGSHLEAAESEEQDEERLEKLYRIDHANTRIRRQAENLQVLLGRRVDDAGSQVTSLVDAVRAATSAIEHYSRVHVGRTVDLAVVEFAADDVIRVLTELLDNATRFSPPTSNVIVSAYLTEQGSVLLRIEDSGVGIKPDQLPALNAMLAGSVPPPLHGDLAAHLGLVVVSRLALANRLRVHLTNRQTGGTTATVLIPDALLCEVAPAAAPVPGPGPAPVRDVPVRDVPVRDVPRTARPAHRMPTSGSPYQAPPPSHLMLVNGQPPEDGGRHGRRDLVTGAGLPRRVRESLRGESGQQPGAVHPFPPAIPESRISPEFRTPPASELDRDAWPDETADFAAGINDFAAGINGAAAGTSDAQLPSPDEQAEGHP